MVYYVNNDSFVSFRISKALKHRENDIIHLSVLYPSESAKLSNLTGLLISKPFSFVPF